MTSQTLISTLDSLEVPNEGYKNNTSQIGKLQEILKYHGYYQGRIDEKLGYKTQRAICHVQKDLGLGVTGQFDEATWYGITFWLPVKKVKKETESKEQSMIAKRLKSIVSLYLLLQ